MKMNDINGDNQKSISEIVDLGRKSKEISKVMEIINTIADQTKLIAFNAALEASSAGEAGKLASRSLVAQGVRHLMVANRSFARAETLAERMGGKPLPWEALDSALGQVDLVITATGASERVLSKDRIQAAVRGGRQLLLIDLAVPRDVDPEVADLPGVTLFNMDDIQRYAQGNLELRALETEKAEAILTTEVGKFQDWWAEQEVVPTVAALRNQAEAIRAEEVRRTLARMDLTEAERERIEAMSRAIVKKLLHRPLVYMKERRDSEVTVDAVRALFGLDGWEE